MLLALYKREAKCYFVSGIYVTNTIIGPIMACLMAEVLLIVALQPTWSEVLWIIFIPMLYCLFATVAGISINLRLHSFDWSKEEVVVKQSAASGLGAL